MFRFNKDNFVNVSKLAIELLLLCFFIPLTISNYTTLDGISAGNYIFFFKGLFQPFQTTVGEANINLDWPSSILVNKQNTAENQSLVLFYKAKYVIHIYWLKPPYVIDDYMRLNLEERDLIRTRSVLTAPHKFRINGDHVYLLYWLNGPNQGPGTIWGTHVLIPERKLKIRILGPNYKVSEILGLIIKIVYGDNSVRIEKEY